MTQPHLPHEHATAMTHTREILRCAVILAMARQAQAVAASELHDQAMANVQQLQLTEQELYDGITFDVVGKLDDFGLDTGPFMQRTAELDAAVDQLTDACVAAQIASQAGGN